MTYIVQRFIQPKLTDLPAHKLVESQRQNGIVASPPCHSTPPRICTYLHTYIHTYIRTYIHTYVCTLRLASLRAIPHHSRHSRTIEFTYQEESLGYESFGYQTLQTFLPYYPSFPIFPYPYALFTLERAKFHQPLYSYSAPQRNFPLIRC